MQTSQRRVNHEVEYEEAINPITGEEVDESTEEEFDATLGSLVDYYSTLPPGLIEAKATPKPAIQPAATAQVSTRTHTRARRNITGGTEAYRQVAAQTPRRRTWAWVLGGAFAMLFGGVASFALMVGPKNFYEMALDKVGMGPPKADVAATGPVIRIIPPKVTKGVPKAEPLNSAKAAVASRVKRSPVVEPLARENAVEPTTKTKEKTAKAVKTPAAPQRTVTLKRKSTRKRVRKAKARTKPVRKAKVRAKKKASSSDANWEDPYK